MKLIDNNLRSFYVKGKLPQWASWLIGIALFSLAWFAVSVWARHAALVDLAKYTDNWTPDGILQQETNYSCVPAALVMLLDDEGIDTTTLDVAGFAGTDIRGTSGGGVIKVGDRFGFDVIHQRMTFDKFLSQDLPAIIIFKYNGIRHAAYITRLTDLNLIRVKDSIQGLLIFQKDEADDYFEAENWDLYLFRRRE